MSGVAPRQLRSPRPPPGVAEGSTESDITTERELKFSIPDAGAIQRILRATGTTGHKRVTQQTFIFDTPQRTLDEGDFVVRVRREAKEWTLTAKGPSERRGGDSDSAMADRIEVEVPISEGLAREINAGRRGPLEALLADERLKTSDRLWVSELIDRWPASHLSCVGTFVNERTRAPWKVITPSGVTSLTLELDHTTYPGGRREFQLEVEIPPGAPGRELEAGVERLLEAAQIAPEVASSKVKRFYQALDGSKASPRFPVSIPMGGKDAVWVNPSELKKSSPARTEDHFEASAKTTASRPSLQTVPRGFPKAVLFDNDGVLVDASVAWFHALTDAATHFGFEQLTWKDFEEKYELSLSKVLDAEALPCPKDELSAFAHSRLPRYLSDIRVNADAPPLLQNLRSHGVRLAVTSNKETDVILPTLVATGLRPYFDAIVGRDQVAKKKPAPDMLFHALSQIGVDPSEAWMIGDAEKDAIACEKAGVRFFGLGVDGEDRLEALREIGNALPPIAGS